MLNRRFATIADRSVHYRWAGDGPPLLMLHAAVNSSATVAPIAEQLAQARRVIAPDLPGYGDSAPFDHDRPSVADYAAWVGQVLDAFGFGQVDLYGTHSGAVFGLEYAIAAPERVRSLVLDGLPVFSAEERADLATNFSPDLTPTWDGTHLLRAWNWRRDMHIYWPWYRRLAEARIQGNLPPVDELYDKFLDVLKGGRGYGYGYQAAFGHDVAAALRRVTVPTLVTASPTDPLRPYLNAITDPSPAVAVQPATSPRPADRAGQMIAFLTGDQSSDGNRTDPTDRTDRTDPPYAHTPTRPHPIQPSAFSLQPSPELPPIPVNNGITVEFVQTSIGPLLLRRGGADSGRPLLFFHGMPGTSANLEGLMRALGRDRPVLAFDMPGTGESALPPGDPSSRDLASYVFEAVSTLGINELDVYGSHTGATLAIEAALGWGEGEEGKWGKGDGQAEPSTFNLQPSTAVQPSVRRLILDGVPHFSDEEAAEFLAHHAPAMVLDSSGSHVPWAWTYIRDRSLWWPWHNRTVEGSKAPRVAQPLPSPEVLHDRVVDFLKGARTYHLAYQAAFTFKAAERLPLLTNPVLLCVSPTDPLSEALPELRSLLPEASTAIHAGQATPESRAKTAELFRAFLDA